MSDLASPYVRKNGPLDFFILLALFFVFFPYIGFISGIDTQPNYIFFLFPLVFVALIREIVISELLVFLLFCFVLVLYTVVDLERMDVKFILSYFLVICCVYFLCVFIKFYEVELSLWAVWLFFLLYVIVGGVQLVYPDFMAWLVHRDVSAVFSYIESGRGVRSLTGEPSHFGKIFSYFNVLLIFIYLRRSDYLSSKDLIRLLFLSLFLVLLNGFLARSAYALSVHILIVSAFALFVLGWLYLLLFFLASFLIFWSVFEVGFLADTRIMKIFSLLLDSPELLLQQGAIRRLLNIPITLNNLSHFGFLGSGGSDYRFLATLDTPLGVLAYEGHGRNMGGVIEIVLRFGLFSVPAVVFVFYFAFLLSRLKMYMGSGRKLSVGYFYVFCFFILMVQDGPPAMPIGWFVFIYILVVSAKCLKHEKLVRG